MPSIVIADRPAWEAELDTVNTETGNAWPGKREGQ